MAKRDYYEVLGVEKTASESDIKKAFRKLSMQHHPDRGGDDKKFHEITEAYEVLSNKEKRQEYDQFGFAGPQSQRPFRYKTQSQSWNDPFDVFRNMGGFDDFFKRSNQPEKKMSQPVQVGITLEFMESIKGTKVKFDYNRRIKCSGCNGTGQDEDSEVEACITCGGSGRIARSSGFFQVAAMCPHCQGKGHIIKKPCKTCGGSKHQLEKRKIEVKIPAGIDDGKIIRIPKEGHRDLDEPGSLVIKIKVNPHEYFTKIQDHIQIHIPLTITQALLGAKIRVPTIHGEKLEVKIPKLTKDGTAFVLKNQGVDRKGVMRIITHIQMPERLTDEEQKILEQLEDVTQSSEEPKPLNLKEI